MSPESIQILTAGGLGLVGSVVVYRLARVRRLSFRYAVGWLTLCGIGMFAGIAAPILEPLARSLKVSPAVVIALGARAGWSPIVVAIVSIAAALAFTLVTYHYLVRSTIIGKWLSGRRRPRRTKRAG